MEFIVPEFNRKENPIGIYRIWFDEKWFYIGSSVRLRSRFVAWKCRLLNPEKHYLKSINIKKVLPETSVIRFEIIKTYKSASWLRMNETKEINKHWDTPLFLNRCPDANSPKGMKPYFGYIKPVKVLKGTPEYMKPVKIAVFNNNWELIKICNSKSEVEREFKFNMSDIKRVLSGERGQPRNIKFKQVSDNGSFIEPVKYVNNKKRPAPKGRPVIQMTIYGDFVSEYISLGEAARQVGCSKQLIFRFIKGNSRLKTAKGYTWKYAQ